MATHNLSMFKRFVTSFEIIHMDCSPKDDEEFCVTEQHLLKYQNKQFFAL